MNSNRRISIAYAGTPEFSATILSSIIRAGFDVKLVLTQIDRRCGRGMKLQMSAVKKIALEQNIPVLQPLTLNLNGKDSKIAHEVHERLFAIKCDVFLVAAYGVLLPASILQLPTYGCVNVHASLLPRWRGAAPIQRMIQAGDLRTGITMMQMDAGLDTGPIIFQESLSISSHDTAGSLLSALADLGSQCTIKILKKLSCGEHMPLIPQNDKNATYAAKLTKQDMYIHWDKSALEIERCVRSLDPYPGACSYIDDICVKIWRVEVLNSLSPCNVPVGCLIKVRGDDLFVTTGDYLLRILELQRPGGKRLKTSDFLSGSLLKEGKQFQVKRNLPNK